MKLKVGYTRIATPKKEILAHDAALMAAGCERIFHETTEKNGRPGTAVLQDILGTMPPKSVLVIWKLDRLATNITDLFAAVRMIKNRKADFVSICEEIDTREISGKGFFKIVSTIESFDKGIYGRHRSGRPDKGAHELIDPMLLETVKCAFDLIERGVTREKAARLVGVSKDTLLRELQKYQDRNRLDFKGK